MVNFLMPFLNSRRITHLYNAEDLFEIPVSLFVDVGGTTQRTCYLVSFTTFPCLMEVSSTIGCEDSRGSEMNRISRCIIPLLDVTRRPSATLEPRVTYNDSGDVEVPAGAC
jgi:hypothetical protein